MAYLEHICQHERDDAIDVGTIITHHCQQLEKVLQNRMHFHPQTLRRATKPVGTPTIHPQSAYASRAL